MTTFPINACYRISRSFAWVSLKPWVRSFLTRRSTRIKLPGYISELFPTSTGIPQGSPISPILFLLFNTPLLSACRLYTGNGWCEGYGWVDDVCIVVESDSYIRNVELLEKALVKADIWARKHAAKFAPDKFELIHFKNPRSTVPIDDDIQPDLYDIDTRMGNDRLPITTNEQIIQPSESAKYLGVWLDQTLSFDAHRAKLSGKGNASLEALRGISGSTWGASLMAIRTVYRAVVIPQLLYGVAAWYCPLSKTTPKVEENRITTIFTAIQRRACILIAGAFKSMSAAALNIELYLLPIKLQMQKTIEETAIRIQIGAT